MNALRCAVIENGKVVNVTMAFADYAAHMGWVPSESANIGDSYLNGMFVPPPPMDENEV